MLFDKVCEHLNLLEKDYFGLLFYENSDQKVSLYEGFVSLFFYIATDFNSLVRYIVLNVYHYKHLSKLLQNVNSSLL